MTMTTVFKRLWASQMSSVIHKEKIMFCHHHRMCPTSRRGVFYLDVWKGKAVWCILSVLLAPLERILKRCWRWSIPNAAENFFWSAHFLSVVPSNSGVRAIHQYHGNAVISSKCPASANTTGLERPRLQVDLGLVLAHAERMSISEGRTLSEGHNTVH